MSGSRTRNSSPPSRAELILGAQVRAHRVGGGDEHVVARLVAVGVVDGLEVVEVEDRDPERVPVTAGGGDHPAELGRIARRFESPVSASSRSSASRRAPCATSSCWSSLVRARGLDAGQDLAVGNGLDQEVLDALAHALPALVSGVKPGRWIITIAVA